MKKNIYVPTLTESIYFVHESYSLRRKVENVSVSHLKKVLWIDIVERLRVL